jgi:hypothetical protein
MQRMLVTHISSSDGFGGAAIAAHRVHEGHCRLGVSSRMLVSDKSTRDENVLAVVRGRGFTRRLRRRLRSEIIARQFARHSSTKPKYLDAFSDDRATERDALLETITWSVICHLHSVAGLLDYPSFFSIDSRPCAPGMDTPRYEPFYRWLPLPAGCDRFAAGCGACPALGSVDNFDLSAAIFRRKRTGYNRLQPEKVRIVAPSRWLCRKASRSLLFRQFDVTTIPYGLDTEVFRTRPRAVA